MARVYLVDATNLLYRAYHALGGFTNAAGMPTHAVFGFVNMMMRLEREEKPDVVVAVFDPPGPTAKHKLFPEYKANREKTPDDFRVQVPYVHRTLKALGIPMLIVEGFEADDVIGTLSARCVARGDEVTIVTGDKDFCQLVTPRVRLLDTMRNKVTGPEEVAGRMEVDADKVIDILALVGDKVDNVPGIPGVGPKGAAKWLNQYGSLEEVVAHAAEIKGKRGEALREHAQRVLANRPLVTIETDLDLPVTDADLEHKPLDRGEAVKLFHELGFNRFIKELGLEDEPEAPAQVGEQVSQASEPDPAWVALVRIEDGRWGVASHGGQRTGVLASDEDAGRWLSEGRKVVGHRLKEGRDDWARLGIGGDNVAFDTELAAYLLVPGRREYKVAELANEHGLSVPAADDPEGLALCVLNLAAALERDLEEAGLTDLFRNIELPLLSILAGMELAGVKVDREKLASLSTEYEGRLGELEAKMFASAGREFNPRSTKELAVILFEELKLPVIKKTATGYSTDAGVLEELSLSHELPGLLLEHRGLTKLKNSFIDTLPKLVNPIDGRIHTTFQQSVAATGRLSSANPNLQNIPVRGEEGRRIREAFVAEPGYTLISADYSQIELRVLAHMSQDATLLDVFATGRDVHAETASRLFDVGPLGVTNEMRRQAKVVNFGILYGMSPFGLATRLGVEFGAAARIIETYFNRFPGVRGFLKGLIAQAHDTGLSHTMLGRIRQIPDLDARNKNRREAAERLATNTPIQGTAADLIKVAMINADGALRREGIDGRMILQVHDELVVEVREEQAGRATELVHEAMEGAARLDVKLAVESGCAHNWFEAHGG